MEVYTDSNYYYTDDGFKYTRYSFKDNVFEYCNDCRTLPASEFVGSFPCVEALEIHLHRSHYQNFIAGL